jgi:hypothetical protein
MDQLSRAEELEQKRSYWKQQIEQWQQTGLTQAEYCRRNNLKHHQLVYWKKRYLKTQSDVSFAAIQLEDLLDIPAPADQASLTVVIDNSLKVEVTEGFDPQLLRQLIVALRGL